MARLPNVIDLPTSRPRVLRYTVKKSFFTRRDFRFKLTVAAIELRNKKVDLTFEEISRVWKPMSTFNIRVYGRNADITWFEKELKQRLQ